MVAMFFQEDDFVITFDPEKVTGVRTHTTSYALLFDEGKVELIPKKYETLCKLILDFVKVNFELPTKVTLLQFDYKLEGYVASHFAVSFSTLDNYIKALKLVKTKLTAKYGVEPVIKEHAKSLAFTINFPPYYSYYKENRDLIISILGEPTKTRA